MEGPMAKLISSRASRPSGGKLAHRLLPSSLLLVVLSVSFAARRAHAAPCTLSSPTTWNIAGNDTWSTNGDWNPAAFPNSSSTNTCITNGTSTVTLDTNASVADLQLASGNTLSTNLGTQLSVFGTQILNVGQIMLNGGAATNTFLNVANNVALSGAGTLTLSTTAGSGAAFIHQSGGTFTLTTVATTIELTRLIGNGGLTVVNDSGGTINANVSGGGLTLNRGGGGPNHGLLDATKSRILQIKKKRDKTGGNRTA